MLVLSILQLIAVVALAVAILVGIRRISKVQDFLTSLLSQQETTLDECSKQRYIKLYSKIEAVSQQNIARVSECFFDTCKSLNSVSSRVEYLKNQVLSVSESVNETLKIIKSLQPENPPTEGEVSFPQRGGTVEAQPLPATPIDASVENVSES